MKTPPHPDTNQPEIVDPKPNAEPEFNQTMATNGGERLFYIGPPKTYTHRIYARAKGSLRYSPLDVKNGNLVVNLFYATMFEKAEALRVATELAKENPEHEFQVRTI